MIKQVDNVLMVAPSALFSVCSLFLCWSVVEAGARHDWFLFRVFKKETTLVLSRHAKAFV